MASANHSSTGHSSHLPSSSLPPSTSDLYLTPETLGMACEEAVDRMQLAAELLLLRSGARPLAIEPLSTGNESYSKSRDAIVANTKGLAISIRELSKNLNQRDLAVVYRLVHQISEQVIILTEASTHAAYLTALTDPHCLPAKLGAVDGYAFARAKQSIHQAYNRFKPEAGHISRDLTLEVSRTLADNLAVLTHGCRLAAESRDLKEKDRTQFANCAQCLQGTTTAFLTSLKSFVSTRSSEDRKRYLLFGRPVLEAVDSVVEFSGFPQFAGTPAELTQRGRDMQTEILGGAMAIVSSSVQLLTAAKALLELKSREESSHWRKIMICSRAVADATKLLSSSLREHTPLPSRRTAATLEPYI